MATEAHVSGRCYKLRLISLIDKIRVSFNFSVEDCLNADDAMLITLVLQSINKTIHYQFIPLLDGWLQDDNIEISIGLESQDTYAAHVKKKADRFVSQPPDYELFKPQKYTEKNKNGGVKVEYGVSYPINMQQFLGLAQTEIISSKGRKFALPVFSVESIGLQKLKHIRRRMIEIIYDALVKFSEHVVSNNAVLDAAYQMVLNEDWFIEKTIGDVVYSEEDEPNKVQLISRWEPDYIYHIARITPYEGDVYDLLFMVYWRAVSWDFFERPGSLSWINSNTLKFKPNSRGDRDLSFKIDRGPIDFSYYFEEPRHRSQQFIIHLLEDPSAVNKRHLKLNY